MIILKVGTLRRPFLFGANVENLKQSKTTEKVHQETVGQKKKHKSTERNINQL